MQQDQVEQDVILRAGGAEKVVSMTPTSDLAVLQRYRWLPKAEIMELLALSPGMNIAEIGAGTGDLILAASEAIGPAACAYAVEPAPEMLARLREKTAGVRNLHVIDTPHYATPIPAGCCHRVVIVNLWTELTDPVAVLHEAARLLREDGRLILIEWDPAAAGPQTPAAGIDLREMVRLLERNGWDIHRHGPAGPYSYFLEAAVCDESVQS